MITPIPGPLPDGATIALQASVRCREYTGSLGFETFGPAYVGLTDWSAHPDRPRLPFLDAKNTTPAADSIFTVTLLPQPHPAVRSSWGLSQCQIITLKASNGNYVANEHTGARAMSATASTLDQADLLIVAFNPPHSCLWTGLKYKDRGTLQSAAAAGVYQKYGLEFKRQIDIRYPDSTSPTLYTVPQIGGGTGQAGVCHPFLIEPDGPPAPPKNLRIG